MVLLDHLVGDVNQAFDGRASQLRYRSDGEEVKTSADDECELAEVWCG